MEYGELIAFEPIDSVKVLRDSDDPAAARRDVETLVVSPRLAEQLTEVILPNLNLDEPRDPKGQVVGRIAGDRGLVLPDARLRVLVRVGPGRIGSGPKSVEPSTSRQELLSCWIRMGSSVTSTSKSSLTKWM